MQASVPFQISKTKSILSKWHIRLYCTISVIWISTYQKDKCSSQSSGEDSLLYGQVIEEVSELCYLGSLINTKSDSTTEIKSSWQMQEKRQRICSTYGKAEACL